MYWIFLVLGLVTLCMVGLQILHRSAFKRTGVRVTGTVVQLDEDDGGYQPTIKFCTLTGEVRYVMDSTSSAYKGLLHQEVTVIYNPENLNEVIFLHRDSVILNIVFLIAGVCFLVMALFLWVFDR